MKIRNILLSIVIASSALFVGCKQTKKSDEKDLNKLIEVTDKQGNKVSMDSVPQRVLCLFDPSLDVVCMLGAQNQIVGIPAEVYHDAELFDYFRFMDPRIAAKEIATPGTNETINIESAITLSPDLVIAQNLSPSVIQTLNNMGIPVYIAAGQTYDDLMKEMNDISILLGKIDRGKELIAFAKEKEEIFEKRAVISRGDQPKKTVYFTWSNGKIFSTAGRNSMMNECLVLAGVENVCPSDIDKPNINPETLLEWNPDMIVMWNDSPNLFYAKKELANIEAIKDKQIFNLDPMFFYNPHTFKALCASSAINGWAYPNPDHNVEHEVQEIIMKLYDNKIGNDIIKYIKL